MHILFRSDAYHSSIDIAEQEEQAQFVFHPAYCLDTVRPNSLAVTSPHGTGRHPETELEPISAQHMQLAEPGDNISHPVTWELTTR
jgi:hypothetical protein